MIFHRDVDVYQRVNTDSTMFFGGFPEGNPVPELDNFPRENHGIQVDSAIKVAFGVVHGNGKYSWKPPWKPPCLHKFIGSLHICSTATVDSRFG